MYLHSPNEKDIRAQLLSSQSYRFHILRGIEKGSDPLIVFQCSVDLV